jgi:hypothetical protein
MHIDPYILAFSALTVLATIWMGFWSARRSKTAHDFFVAGRSVSVGWNASAISGEYLSAASFMGVAGMVMSSGYDALWYPVCYACGYLFLLLFIAGPLRRFGAYTIPDFAEGRYDSPLFRKIAVVFVLFIGFFYTMPQMKGAGTTLAYIFPGLPYWAGVVLVGAVITLNVALGGMKGITLVQAFQYWLKMFAISVPIFVLMAVYGHYGKQIGVNAQRPTPNVERSTDTTAEAATNRVLRNAVTYYPRTPGAAVPPRGTLGRILRTVGMDVFGVSSSQEVDVGAALDIFAMVSGRKFMAADGMPQIKLLVNLPPATRRILVRNFEALLKTNGVTLVQLRKNEFFALPTSALGKYQSLIDEMRGRPWCGCPFPKKPPTTERGSTPSARSRPKPRKRLRRPSQRERRMPYPRDVPQPTLPAPTR